MENIYTKEIMIARNGKPLYAVVIDNSNFDEKRDRNYVYVEDGDIKFASSWLSSITPFELGNESHRLAKEIFTIGLQAAIKTKIYELKQLEAILKDINLSECLGDVLVDNTKLLLEVNDNINKKTAEIVKATSNNIKKEELKETVETAIVETVNPIAVKKSKKKKEDTNNGD